MARGHRRGSWVGLAAAYLLFVQALLTGAGLGARAAPAVDFHGAVICTAGHDDHGRPAAPADHDGDAALCCVLGCAATGAALPPPDAAITALSPRRQGRAAPLSRADPIARAAERTPRRTRAPPIA